MLSSDGPRDIRETHDVLISFDYEGHDQLSALTTALASFMEAFNIYARGKKTSMKIAKLEPGSLQCHLIVNHDAKIMLDVIAKDFSDLRARRPSPLIPQRARKPLRKLLENISSISISDSVGSATLTNEDASVLAEPSTSPATRLTSHAGFLDRIDLRANQFRIMLPHGQHLTCNPADQFLPELSLTLNNASPRVSVAGEGIYRGADFLPGTMRVRHVRVLPEPPQLSSLISALVENTNVDEVLASLDAYSERLEQRFASDEDSD